MCSLKRFGLANVRDSPAVEALFFLFTGYFGDDLSSTSVICHAVIHISTEPLTSQTVTGGWPR